MPPKKLGLVGLLIAFLVALPIFVWSIVNLNFNPKEKAIICKERPTCLDAVPHPCQIAEPDEGWCLAATATPTVPPMITPTPTATPTSTATATPTTPPIGGGKPNYCGGTCGSNFNCQANYYCFQGFCRNPVCPSDTNCDCVVNATATATPKKTITPKPTKTTTAKPTFTAKPTLTISPTAIPTPTESGQTALIEKDLENQFLIRYALPIFGVFALIVISTIFYALKKNKNPNNIPHISPPTNI